VRKARSHVAEEDRDLAADHVVERGPSALVRHVRHLDAGLLAEELAREVLRRAASRRGEGDAPGFCFATAMSSFTSFAGNDGVTTRTFGNCTRSEIGWNAFAAS
jgi:hypothetical protein